MGLEELAFDVEGVKVYLKPELHKYHNDAAHDPFIGLVPIRVEYGSSDNAVTKEGFEGFQRYDCGKGIFLNALSDYVPTDSNDTELLEKYAQGMSEVAKIYSTILHATRHLNKAKIITEKHFYRNFRGQWKDIGTWHEVLSDAELKQIADSIE